MSHTDYPTQAAQPTPAPVFDVVVQADRERTLVRPQGELDLVTVVQLEAVVQQQLSRGASSVVLDLRELTFMDSTGLRLLLQLDSEARSGGFTFAIIDADGPVRRLLTLTRLRMRFNHAPD